MTDRRGSKPDDKIAGLRPTIISPPATRRAPEHGAVPTSVARPKQTALGPDASASPAPVVLPEPGQPAPPSRPMLNPTAIPGLEPERIAVEPADLRKLSPEARPEVRERALALVQGFVVGGASERKAVLWGHGLQQEYGELVSYGLGLSRSDVLGRVTFHLGRMTTILSSIDLEAACGLAPGSGLLGRVLRQANVRIDTPEELMRARGELDQLMRLLGEALPQLLSLKEAIERHWRQVEAVGDEVEAAALAAEVLSLRLSEARPALAGIYLDRSIGLTQTVAQIRSSTGLREVQVEQPLRLIRAIQDVALVTLPGWLGSIAALEATALRGPITPTEAGELAHQLRSIVQNLTP